MDKDYERLEEKTEMLLKLSESSGRLLAAAADKIAYLERITATMQQEIKTLKKLAKG